MAVYSGHGVGRRAAREHGRRIDVLAIVVVLMAGLLAVRLYIIQIVKGSEFSLRADGQYVVPDTLYDRGSIFFTRKDGIELQAAGLGSGFSLAIVPAKIDNAEKVFSELFSVVKITKDKFMKQAAKKDDPYEAVAHRLDKDDAKTIKSFNLPGVIISEERWRSYPAGAIAPHILGFVGFDGDKFSGRYGLERYYDDVLERGRNRKYVNFFAELFAGITNALRPAKNVSGDIVLYIEPVVQTELSGELKSLIEKWDASSAGGIIMNPLNGDIVAMASFPDFDPNIYYDEEDESVYTNPLVENVFEMGSIVKPITLAAGIDAGVISPETEYFDSGNVSLNGATISNFDGRGRGRVNMQQVLNQSLNTGAVFVESRLGNKVFAEYIKKFGLGEETGIDLPNETRGLLKNLESPRDLEYATASFGQGVAFTPIGTARALSSLANGGMLVTPHVVEKIKTDIGFIRKVETFPPERVISQESSEEITRMLVRVMDEALVGGRVALPRYSIAVKTGTAQIADLRSGGYYDDRFFHSFFGYFPAYNPRFLIFLYLNEPKGVKYASHTLTDPFMKLVKLLISYYEIPPDR